MKIDSTRGVDTAKASDKARKAADQVIYCCYPAHERNSARALAHWADKFKREFHALTQPTPYPVEKQ